MSKFKKFFVSTKLRLLLVFLLNLALMIVASVYNYLYLYYILSVTIACVTIFFLANRKEKDTYKVTVFLLTMSMPLFGITYAVLTKERKGDKKVKKEWANILYRNRKTNLPSDESLDSLKHSSVSAYKTGKYLVETIGMPCYDKTDIRYYGSGEKYFSDLFETCKKAKKYILIECYKIKPGRIWWTLFDILRLKAREGVKIKLVYDDGVCTKFIPNEDFEKMRNHGIETVPFNRMAGLGNSFLNCRNFKRIIVVDGEVGFMSGYNLTDEYISMTGDDRDIPTKDAGIRFTGLAVRNLIVSFFEDYQYASKKVIKLQEYFVDAVPAKAKNWILPYSTNPVSVGHSNKNILLSMIDNARESIIITTTYISLNDELKNALIMASKSGVDVKVVYCGETETKRVKILAKSFFAELIKEGIHVYEINNRRMTSRLIIVDNNSAVISTNNLDCFSTYRHFNCGVYMFGEVMKDIAKDVSEIVSNAQPVSLKDIQKRKVSEKISANWSKVIAIFR